MEDFPILGKGFSAGHRFSRQVAEGPFKRKANEVFKAVLRIS